MIKGHCLCGAVSYEYQGEVNWRGHCHCESCRRNCSAPMTTFFGVNNTQWKWTGDAPKAFQSSKKATRLFCETCGTPMAYISEQFPDETHFYAASLENPADFEPKAHFFYAEKLPWLPVEDELKKHGVGGLEPPVPQ